MSQPVINNNFDVLIIGAGLSGICAGYHIQTKCPTKSYAILEGRSKIGGTWDLFKYPGVRSDSDMYTLGYSFNPWKERKSIADGPSILKYVNETASQFGIDKHIVYNIMIKKANFSTDKATWVLEGIDSNTNGIVTYSCNFLMMATGYYDYQEGFTPIIPGMENFKGIIAHPQQWPEDLDYKDKEVVVIGSGATAITIVPSMADTAKHVTMLQRSPTYIFAAPAIDKFANFINRVLPASISGFINKWLNVTFMMASYFLCRTFPNATKKFCYREIKKQLGPDFDVKKHFSPKYEPWDQRFCLAPDGDLFNSIKDEKASVVTDTIKEITATGIMLNEANKEIKADIIVMATGLKLQVLSDMEFKVDDVVIDVSTKYIYKGLMISDIPNVMKCLGYTNASWTLKCDLTCNFTTRIINHMDKINCKIVCPRPIESEANMTKDLMFGFNSTYVTRSIGKFPKQGSHYPWRLSQNYFSDFYNFTMKDINDEHLKYY